MRARRHAHISSRVREVEQVPVLGGIGAPHSSQCSAPPRAPAPRGDSARWGQALRRRGACARRQRRGAEAPRRRAAAGPGEAEGRRPRPACGARSSSPAAGPPAPAVVASDSPQHRAVGTTHGRGTSASPSIRRASSGARRASGRPVGRAGPGSARRSSRRSGSTVAAPRASLRRESGSVLDRELQGHRRGRAAVAAALHAQPHDAVLDTPSSSTSPPWDSR